MLIIDHIASGILISTSIEKKRNLAIISVCILSSILPDVLVIFGVPGSILYLDHRKFTNTLLFAPLYSIFSATIIFLIFKKRLKFKTLFVYSFISYLIHILLDLVTPFGSPLFYPISLTPYSLDIFHAFDPIFLCISIIAIAVFIYKAVIKRNGISKAFNYIFISIYIIYAMISISLKYKAESEFINYLSSNSEEYLYITTLPRTFWRWKGIVDYGESFKVIVTDKNDINSKYYPKLNLPIKLENHPDVKRFLEYARYPSYIVKDDKILLINLIYSPDSYALELRNDTTNTLTDLPISGFNIKDDNY